MESLAEPVVLSLREYTQADAEEIMGDEPDPFDQPRPSLVWMPKTEHFGVQLNGRLIAHAGIVPTKVLVSGQRVDMVGFGGVIVARPWRGRGLARRVMEAATFRARELGPDFGLLFCNEDRCGLYRKIGWRALDPKQEVFVGQPGGDVIMPLQTMWTSLHGRLDWPNKDLRLLSLPM